MTDAQLTPMYSRVEANKTFGNSPPRCSDQHIFGKKKNGQGLQ